MNIKERLKEIYNSITELEKERDAIREVCTHPTYIITTVEWRIGSYDNMRMCCECNEFGKIGSPTDEELEEFHQELIDKEPIAEVQPINKKYSEGLDLTQIKRTPMGIGTKIYKNEYKADNNGLVAKPM